MISISVASWDSDEWDFIGRDAMYDFYRNNPKEAKKDGHQLDENGEVKCLDDIAGKNMPILGTFYFSMISPSLSVIFFYRVHPFSTFHCHY